MDLTILRQRQSNPLAVKEQMSLLRIRSWYEMHDGNVHVAYSGGKDSTVLLHLVRSLYPDVPAVFCNTGVEFPEIVRFCHETPNTIAVLPKMPFIKVVRKYGYPVVSKEQARFISEYRNSKSEKLRNLRLYGRGKGLYLGKISNKWQYLLNAPFPISHKCCDILKKRPAHKYMKDTGSVPYIGYKAVDSMLRRSLYVKYGCNADLPNRPFSAPLGFWLNKDIDDYAAAKGISFCSIYDKGYENTGCVYCCFGIHNEMFPNRFQRLAATHPKLWHYAMYRVGLKPVLDYMRVPYYDCRLEPAFCFK